MFKLKYIYASVMCLSLMVAGAAQSALAANDILLQLQAEEEIIVKNSQGKLVHKRIAADKIEPGDVIVYTMTYHNQGDAAADQLVINDPIPKDTVYIAGSANTKHAVVTFSLNGKHFASAKQLMVSLKNGKKRLARVDEYRHIRWTLVSALAAGKKGKVSFKARVK